MNSEAKDTKGTDEEIAKKLAPEVIRTILQDGVDFEVTSNRKSLFRRRPINRKFIIYPIKLGTLFNISKIILTMKELQQTNKDFFSAGIDSIVENKDKMLEVMALAIINRKISTPWQRIRKWCLKRYLDKNLDAREMFKVIHLTIMQMDVTDFLASFVSIKSMNLVEAIGKKPDSSTIGKSSEAL